MKNQQFFFFQLKIEPRTKPPTLHISCVHHKDTYVEALDQMIQFTESTNTTLIHTKSFTYTA